MNLHSSQKSRSKLKQTQEAKSLSKSFHHSSPPKLNVDGEALRLFQVPYLTKLMESFHKDIENPIDAITAVFLAKAPQRCLHHNNIITLYCPNDAMPLCVTCMYQNNSHKKHKVMPINRATQQLRQETHRRLHTVALELDNMSSMLLKTHSHLKKAEREYPELINKVERFYFQLHEMLVKKKQQQLEHIKQTWGRLRYEYSTLANQLDKINIYVRERIAAIHHRPGEEHVLLNRNIASYLAHLPKLLSPDFCNYRQTRYDIELSKFQEIKNSINKSLVFTSPFEEVVSRSPNRKRSKSTSKERASLSPAPKSNKKRQVLKDERNIDRNRQRPSKSPTQDKSLRSNRSYTRR